MNADFWDKRFSETEYVYGEQPNEFFRSSLLELPSGRLFLPAEGEGRNAVFAATQGWQVDAIDWSTSGKEKAELLAKKNGTSITYSIAELTSYIPTPETYDAVGLIFVHMLQDDRTILIKNLTNALKTGGTLIFEAFSKNQLGKSSGGPQDPDLLYSLEEVISDFIEFDFLHLTEEEIELKEGPFHTGPGSVIRFIGRKP